MKRRTFWTGAVVTVASADATVDSWMTSEGHRQNLLNPVFRHAGIGYVFNDRDGGAVRYRHYWALTLGALLREP